MIRWSYVATRVFVLALIVGIAWALLNPVLKIGMIYSGQAAVGARVEIGSVRTLLTKSRIDIDQIAVANPNSPMKNMLEIAHASFDVETSSALKKRLVVSEGRLSGLRFHTGRADSGQLADAEEKNEKTGPSVFEKYGDLGEQWLDKSLDRMEERAEQEFVSIRLAKELEDRWPKEYDAIEQRAEDLSRRGKQLAKQVEAMADRPLDHLDKIQATLQEADRLRRDASSMKSELGRLKQQIAQDRIAIENAKQHDLDKVKQTLKFKGIDGDQLSDYLLGPELHEKISTALGWIQWTRGVVSSGESPQSVEPASRGRNVIFPCMVGVPDVLVRKLLVDGGGTVDGKEFTFDGYVKDITHQPKRHQHPATVVINSSGAIELVANAILDRRGEQPTEHFIVDIPALTQSARSLGDPGKLAVDVSPGKAQVRIDVMLRDEAVAGTINFQQDNVKVTPQLKQAYSKEILAANADSAFDSIQSIRATVKIGGTVKKPKLKLRSNLGPQLAAGMNAMLKSELAAREKQLEQKADAEIDRQIAKVEQKLVAKHGEVLKKLELGDREIGMLKSHIASRIGAPSDVLDKGKDLLNLFRR
ncbi:MAG: TIGR03545 family protein [Planctomycetales bacterium]|nr:TIGR03545 family protein [Planctomycetales bacterium]